MTKNFVQAIHDFAKQEGVDIVAFAKGQRKDEVTQEHLAKFSDSEGVLYMSRKNKKPG